MTIFGLDYQQFWLLVGAVWFVLQVTGLIILAAGVGALNRIADVLETLTPTLSRGERGEEVDDKYDEMVR
jgi:hypothetical protein